MINSNYKAIVYGKYLSEKTKRIKGHMCIVKKFYFKTAMVNWVREQINMPNTKPTCVQFFVKKNHVWELKAKVQVKIPINQRKKRTLIWGVNMFEILVIMLSSFGLGCCSMFMFRRYLDRKNIFRSYYAQGLFLVRNWGRQT